MHRTATIAALLGVVALTSACAQNPDAIAPISMTGAFDTMSCTTAQQSLAQERQTLAALEQKQRSAATGDAFGVFLIGVPISSVAGNDVAGSIAASKGKVIALEQRVARC